MLLKAEESEAVVKKYTNKYRILMHMDIFGEFLSTVCPMETFGSIGKISTNISTLLLLFIQK